MNLPFTPENKRIVEECLIRLIANIPNLANHHGKSDGGNPDYGIVFSVDNPCTNTCRGYRIIYDSQTKQLSAIAIYNFPFPQNIADIITQKMGGKKPRMEVQFGRTEYYWFNVTIEDLQSVR